MNTERIYSVIENNASLEILDVIKLGRARLKLEKVSFNINSLKLLISESKTRSTYVLPVFVNNVKKYLFLQYSSNFNFVHLRLRLRLCDVSRLLFVARFPPLGDGPETKDCQQPG